MSIKRLLIFFLIGSLLGIGVLFYAFKATLPAEEYMTVDDLELSTALSVSGPNPGLSPAKVIKIQLKALKQNTAADEGIAKVFAFSSPGNRQITGPIGKFRQLIHSETYKDLLNFSSCKFSKVETQDGIARQLVEIKTKSGKKILYLFQVSKQAAGPYANCWMTDAVIRMEDKGEVIGTEV